MTDTNANIPGASPLVDSNGQITPVWYQFLLAIFNRTGGSGTPPDITGLQQQVDAQEVEINSTSVAIPPPSNAITYRPVSNIFRSVESKLRESVSIKDFGAKIDGVTDDTAAWQKAMASGELDIYFPPGTSVISGSVVFSSNYQRIRGAGKWASRLLMQSGTLSAITQNSGLTGLELRDFHIDRTVVAVQGANGVNFALTGSNTVMDNLLSTNHYNGFFLGPTDYAKVNQCISQQNYSDGFFITNANISGPCQWSISQCLSQMNDGSGLRIDGTVGTSGQMSLGEISEFSTFGNTGFGLIAVALAANPIASLRITGGFLGGDGQSEIFLDTYSGQHKIIGVEMELTGTSPTGRTFQTAASHAGSGLAITPNNVRVQGSDLNINGTSGAGIAMNGTILSLSNPHITNCGTAGITGTQNGITAVSGRTMVVGGYISDTGQGSQLFGVSMGAGVSVNLTGVDLTGNVTAPYTGAGVSVSNIVNCLPNIAITSYTPTVTATTGTFTTASATGGYYVVGKMVYFEITVTITTVGTASNFVLATLPIATNSAGGVTAFNGVERVVTGKTLQGFVSANATSMNIRNYDSTSPIAAGAVLVMSGCYMSN